MRRWRFMLMAALAVLMVALLAWIAQRSPAPDLADHPAPATSSTLQPLRIGLVPERDIFAQRSRFEVLAAYLASRLNRPVQLVTVSSYQAVLQDFAQGEVDCAFLGSLVTVLTVDRAGGRVLLNPQMLDGRSTYRGVIFVRDDSPLGSVKDLRGRRVAVVRTTTGGNLFPIASMLQNGIPLEGPEAPQLVWVGTHDDAVLEVIEGRCDAGAVKDLRLEAVEREHAEVPLRRLAMSGPVPENALVVRSRMPAEEINALRDTLLGMEDNQQGRAVLAAFGAGRFLPCNIGDYQEIYDLVEHLGPAWNQLGIQGPAPRRPTDLEPSSGG